MRSIGIPSMLLFAAIAARADAPPRASGPGVVDHSPKASRVIEGRKAAFPAESIPEGVKRLAGVLESCHDRSDGTVKYTANDLEKARKGDHVRFVLPKPLEVKVLDRRLRVTEAVYADGRFWLTCGNEVVRCTKYTHDRMTRFQEWYRQALPAD